MLNLQQAQSLNLIMGSSMLSFNNEKSYFKISVYLLSLFVLATITACGQKRDNYKTKNQEVIAINKNAVDILFKITGGHREPKSTLDKLEKDLLHAIKLDEDYKGSYVNLIHCIETSSEFPFPEQQGYFSKLIDVCNRWVIRHPDDMDMIIKRGIYYEKNEESLLSNKDYATVLNYLNGLNLIVKNQMNVDEISMYTNYAFLYITVREQDKALKIIDELRLLYPKDVNVLRGHKIIHGSTRQQLIYNYQ